MDNYEFNVVGTELYGFIWNDFCDWYIELAKGNMNNTTKAEVELAKKMLKGKIDIDEVAIMTGLPEEQLKAIADEVVPKNTDAEILKNLDTVDLNIGPILFDDLPAGEEDMEE